MPTVRFQLRRDTAGNWAGINPTLGPGEPALEIDTGKGKHGDGVTPWASLPYSWVPPSAFMQSLLDDVDAAAARLTLGAVGTTRSISTGTGLVGGGNLSEDRLLSLATSGVTAGSYGSATKIPTITLDAYGRATIASENTIISSGTWTPAVTAGAGTITAYTASGSYTKISNLVTATVSVTITDPGSAGGTLLVSLPFAIGPAAYVGSGRENAAIGKQLQVFGPGGSSSMAIFTYDNASPIGPGHVVLATLIYATA